MKTVRVALPVFCIGLAVLAAPARVDAQSVPPLSVEGYAGVGVPTGDFSQAADPSLGLGVTVTYDLAPMLGIRAGYAYQRFGGTDQADVAEKVDADWSDSGFALGLELSPVLAPGLNLLLHADAILHQLKVSASQEGASESLASDRSFGFDVGAGVAFPVTPRVSIVPRVRYRKYTAFDNVDSTFRGPVDRALEAGAFGSINHFAAGLGLKVRF